MTETPLALKLKERIRRDGPISIAEYVDACLNDPEYGYYRRQAAIGAAGDFVTAPEISPLFSRCVAAQCAEVLAALGGGDILEVGAGSGVMAADLLAELEVLEQLPRRYLILELSADLRQRQRALLAERAARRRAVRLRKRRLHGRPQGVAGSRRERACHHDPASTHCDGDCDRCGHERAVAGVRHSARVPVGWTERAERLRRRSRSVC